MSAGSSQIPMQAVVSPQSDMNTKQQSVRLALFDSSGAAIDLNNLGGGDGAVASVDGRTGTVILSDLYAGVDDITKLRNGFFYVADYGTNVAAIQTAINDAVAAAIADETYSATVVFENRVYECGTTLHHHDDGSAIGGNALILIPYVDPAVVDQKVVLTLLGYGDASQLVYWEQTVPQRSGTVLATDLVVTSLDGTYGLASVVGGPTKLPISPAPEFSNMLLRIDGISVSPPHDSGLCGFDAYQIAQVSNGSWSYLAKAVVGGTPNLHDIPTHDLSMGFRFPGAGNNDNVYGGRGSVEGAYYGIGHADHFTCESLRTIYCDTSAYIYHRGGHEHGAVYPYLSNEGCNHVFVTGSSGTFPIQARVDVEAINDVAFVDASNALVGEIMYSDNSDDPPTVSGCARLKIIDMSVDPGAFTPSVPDSGSPSDLIYRDTDYYVTAGAFTDLVIDNVDVGIQTHFRVPSGKSYTPTYDSVTLQGICN